MYAAGIGGDSAKVHRLLKEDADVRYVNELGPYGAKILSFTTFIPLTSMKSIVPKKKDETSVDAPVNSFYSFF